MPKIIQDETARAFARLNRLAVFFLPFLLSLGCHTVSRSALLTSKATFSTGTVVEQTGEAKAPAKAEVRESLTTLTIPAASPVTISPQGVVQIAMNEASQIQTKVVTESFTAPQSFTPPSPTETATAAAKASGVRWYYAAGLGCLLVSGLLLYLEHPKAALICFAGAFVVPLVGNVLSSEYAMHVLVAVLCVSGGLVGGWYLLRNKMPEHVATLAAKARQDATNLELQAAQLVRKL